MNPRSRRQACSQNARRVQKPYQRASQRVGTQSRRASSADTLPQRPASPRRGRCLMSPTVWVFLEIESCPALACTVVQLARHTAARVTSTKEQYLVHRTLRSHESQTTSSPMPALHLSIMHYWKDQCNSHCTKPLNRRYINMIDSPRERCSATNHPNRVRWCSETLTDPDRRPSAHTPAPADRDRPSTARGSPTRALPRHPRPSTSRPALADR